MISEAPHISVSARALPPVCAAMCLHCGSALGAASTDGYCCVGCRTVRQLLIDGDLMQYYAVRGDDAEPARDVIGARRDHKWLEGVATRLAESPDAQKLTLKVQGLHCAACVWLIDQLFARQEGALRVIVNPGRGTLELYAAPTFSLLRFADELAAFGYLLGEIDAADTSQAQDDLLLRTAICLALGGNAMMFAAAIYLGLQPGPLYRVLHTLSFACATLAVLIGGPTFIRSAYQAASRGILHLDLPIAVGIVLTYGAAVWSFISGDQRAAYYDSLATFIGLMLLGRWLKERIVVRNRRQLLAESGAEQLWVRRVRDDRIDLVRAPLIEAGDVLLVPPGDLVPVASVLTNARAECSLDWINGESEPRGYDKGDVVPGGAFNAGTSPLRVIAQSTFDQSEIAALLEPTHKVAPPTRDSVLSFSGIYVLCVLLAAGGCLLGWWLHTADLVRGLEVATAVCVVTCPCAIGIATPLAYDLVLAGLRRAGMFVRADDFLDRARSVRRVVFDKTGTLTTGRLELSDDDAIRQLAPSDRDTLYTMVAGSTHPKSGAVQRAMLSSDALLVRDAVVREVTGCGVEAQMLGATYRLGRHDWATAERGATHDDLTFSRDGRTLCTLRTRELLRSDARTEAHALDRDGFQSWILSGDTQARVETLASDIGVPSERAVGDMSPSDKALWIKSQDRGDVLMIGDGLNDSLAVQQAFASGTPSIDRAFMPWRTDFYFTTPGLSPIRVALRAARRLAHVTRRNQVFAVAYNVLTVGVAAAGLMRPWMAAILMPLSSIVVLVTTSASLSRRSRLWTS